MPSDKKAERKRGLKEAREQIKRLQEKWPVCFPKERHLARPLAASIVPLIAEEMGWSLPYTRGVLQVWKNRDAYCSAVLQHRLRINLDGSASTAEVDDRARAFAQARLTAIAAKQQMALSAAA